MEFALERCTLRPFRLTDQESIARHANDREVWINLRDRFPHPYTLADARAWIELVEKMMPVTHFAIEVDGEAVGSIGITTNDDIFRRSAEIGYWLGRAYWGRGITTEAVKAITAWSFESLDFCRIHAGVFAWNHASARVLEKAGYLLEGRLIKSVTKNGQIIDQLLYAITR